MELLELEGVDEETQKQIRRWQKGERTRAAAWLVRKHRVTIRKLGACLFFVPKGKEFPPWFEWAVAELKIRSRSWRVEDTVRDDGGRAITVVRLRRRT